MSSIDEKRVHNPNTDSVVLFVATDIGLLRVVAAGERVGEISLLDRRAARDLATAGNEFAVATDEDVLLGEDLAETGFGPAVAVGFADGVLAAAPDGTVARRHGDAWTECGTLGEVRAIDGGLLATESGVYRLAGGELTDSGLGDVRDVTARGVPRAATAAGLYRLANGWMDELDGDFEMVDAAPTDGAYAATTDEFYAFDGEWNLVEGIDRSVVDVARGMYAVCADGTLLTATDKGWRDHPLGAGEARAVVARPDRKPV